MFVCEAVRAGYINLCLFVYLRIVSGSVMFFLFDCVFLVVRLVFVCLFVCGINK